MKKTFLLALTFLTLSPLAFAAGIECSSGACNFNDLNNAPPIKHDYYYCKVMDTSHRQTITMTNYNVLSAGFDSEGIATFCNSKACMYSLIQLNNVYFDAINNINQPQIEQRYVEFTGQINNMKCYPGMGADRLPLGFGRKK